MQTLTNTHTHFTTFPTPFMTPHGCGVMSGRKSNISQLADCAKITRCSSVKILTLIIMKKLIAQCSSEHCDPHTPAASRLMYSMCHDRRAVITPHIALKIVCKVDT